MRWLPFVLLAGIAMSGCGGAESMRMSAPGPISRPDRGNWPKGGTIAGLPDESGAEENSREDDQRGPAASDEPAPPVELAQVDAPGAPAAAEVPGKPQGAGKPDAARPAAAQPAQRRIIYKATLHLVVKSVDDATGQIGELLRQHDGYVADSEIGSPQGGRRTGRWVLRIPVARYDAFLAALGPVGIPENVQQKAEDVTSEFVDLTARISNQRRLEDRLKTLLEQRDGKLKDAIEVERELARVRGDIESMEGRLRYLQNQVSFSTVTLHVREELNYVPPQAPSFGGRVSAVWTNSLRALREFGQGLVLFAVGAAPWLPLLAVALAAFRLLLRRFRSRRAGNASGM